MNSYLHALGTAVPKHAYAQSQLLEFMLEKLQLQGELAERLSAFYQHSGIQTRHSVVADFAQQQGELFASRQSPDLSARMHVYHREVLPLAQQAIDRALQQSPYALSDVTHLLAVSCTGLAAPGLDLMLMRELHLPADLQRTCLYFMGCYAAIQALKQADAICRSQPNAVVLLVCAELCTLHFQYTQDFDSLTSSMLFADGAAAAVLSARPGPVEIQGFYSEVALEGWDEMAWNLSETGFLMKLGAGVPRYLEQQIEALVARAQAHFGWDGIERWALHPGGRKILDLAQSKLDLAPEALAASYQVLRDFGNMSSPTILFVLEALQQQKQANERVFAAAFGPGLTLESMGLRFV